MKKNTLTEIGILTEYELRYILHPMRQDDPTWVSRKVKLDELPQKLVQALKDKAQGEVRRIDRGAWQVLNVPSEELQESGFHFASFEMRVYQEGIMVFESYSQDGEEYPGDDIDHEKNAWCTSVWIPFDEE